jgi:hypothetical protein
MGTINLAAKYSPILDEIYKREACTAPLMINPENIRFGNAGTVYLFEYDDLNGFGNYSRSGGFVAGAVTNKWTPYTLTQDRGRSFQVDTVDNAHTMNMLYGRLLAEFTRTRVIPEVDAYRFATLAATTGIGGASADITVGTTDVPGLIDTGMGEMDDSEVPVEGRILFVSELTYRGLKAKITRYLANENGVNREVEIYNDMIVRRVPKSRFCTGITMLDGTTSGQTDGGYTFTASSSKPINFMIVHPTACAAIMEHSTIRQFSPDVNQTADAYKLDYRMFHDILIPKKKVKGIYVHTASTALAADIHG